MGSVKRAVKGRCLCGTVTFSADVARLDADACHCNMCRRWSAGPFIGLPHDGEVSFTGTDSITRYKSSEWAERAFCKICGSSLFYHLLDTDHYSLSASALDDQTELALTSQIFIDEKPRYYDFANDTPKLTGKEVFEAFNAGKDAEL